MTDLYLIAHKVRGEAAFDIATQISCPECNGNFHGAAYHKMANCPECEGDGYWWIIPTSGHRAYPYWWSTLDNFRMADYGNMISSNVVEYVAGKMPIDLPDHYPVRASPKEPKRNLLAELGLSKPVGHPAIAGKLNRRI